MCSSLVPYFITATSASGVAAEGTHYINTGSSSIAAAAAERAGAGRACHCQAIEEQKLKHQLADPGDHRSSPAENATKHAKAHLIAMLACVGKNFSKKSWHLLLPHAEHTASMLRPSKANPLVSAYTMLNGHHGFRRNPLAPAGTKAIAHEGKNDALVICGRAAEYNHLAEV